MSANTSRRLLGLVLSLTLMLALAGCGKQAGQGGAGGTAASNTVELKMSEFSFSPKEVHVKSGQPVTITLVNQGADAHNLVIDALGVKSQDVQAGQQGQVTFTPNQKGSFKMYCSMPGHEASGMSATLVVE